MSSPAAGPRSMERHHGDISGGHRGRGEGTVLQCALALPTSQWRYPASHPPVHHCWNRVPWPYLRLRVWTKERIYIFNRLSDFHRDLHLQDHLRKKSRESMGSVVYIAWGKWRGDTPNFLDWLIPSPPCHCFVIIPALAKGVFDMTDVIFWLLGPPRSQPMKWGAFLAADLPATTAPTDLPHRPLCAGPWAKIRE